MGTDSERGGQRDGGAGEPTGPDGVDGPGLDDDGVGKPLGLSPNVLAYLVGVPALGLLIVFRQFGLVARVPVWAYLAAIVGGLNRVLP